MGMGPASVAVRPGQLGQYANWLGGSVSPCCVVEFLGRRFLYIVGAEGPRFKWGGDDDGPAWRRLIALEISTTGQIIQNFGPVIEHFPNLGKPGDCEEGIFCAAPIVEGDELRLYVGEVLWVRKGEVDVRTALYRSTDGINFTRVRTVTQIPGVEVGPVAAFRRNGRDNLFEFFKQRRDPEPWADWQLGVNGRKVEPRVQAGGGSGPFPQPNGRMHLLVVPHVTYPLMPDLKWWSFDPDTPWKFRPEPRSAPTPGFHCEVDGDHVFALDSRRDPSARIVTLRETSAHPFLGRALPKKLNSDPRFWKVNGSIQDAKWRGDLLQLTWSPEVGNWPTYPGKKGRLMYGALGVLGQAGEVAYLSGVEHFANSLTDPTVPDPNFEGLGDPHDMGIRLVRGEGSKTFSHGEELIVFGAAPFRGDGDGPTYPEDVGIDPVRTRMALLRFGVDGVEDVEPEDWFVEEEDEMYDQDQLDSMTVKVDVPEWANTNETQRIDFQAKSMEVDTITLDRPKGLEDAWYRVNAGGEAMAVFPPGANPVITRERLRIRGDLVLTVRRPDGLIEAGSARVILSGKEIE